MVRLTVVMLVLMCTSMAWARSINPAAANLEQSEASLNETASCMTRFLQLLTPTILDIPGKELVMRNLPPPIIDEANAQSSRLLSGVLGGAGRAQQLVSCLTGQLEPCRQSHPCNNAGKCIFSTSATRASQGVFQCRCESSHTGQFCQTVLELCASNPCRNGGTCEAKQGAYHCHCPPFFSGKHCGKQWLHERKAGEMSAALENLSKDMQLMKTEVKINRRQDVEQIRQFLQRMEQRVLSSVNSNQQEIRASLEKVRQDTSANITSIRNSLLLLHSKPGGWIYRGVLLKAATLSSNAVNIPSFCSPYQPGNSAWGRSDYIAICEHFATAGTLCGSIDMDHDGGLCNNYQALLSFENNGSPDVWLNSGSFSYNPSAANPATCNLPESSPAVVVYACRFF
eukprot:scpid78618/ scgid25732/ Protocadherin Fat 1; Cadherin family member 7; Cadherin-related tumor suppressor homolog; Protein fat homolog; Protocadherin Fat 1, nuclear form